MDATQVRTPIENPTTNSVISSLQARANSMTKYFVDGNGIYIGGFDGAEPPAGAVEVASAPEDARQIWQNGVWSAAPAAKITVPKSTVMARVTSAGKMAAAQAALWAQPDQFAKWFAPDQPNVNCDDPATVAFVTALGLDPAVILAP